MQERPINLNENQMGQFLERLQEWLIGEGVNPETLGGLEVDAIEETADKFFKARYSYEDPTRNCELRRGEVESTAIIQPEVIEDLFFDNDARAFLKREKQ
jgi:hypothetical protein